MLALDINLIKEVFNEVVRHCYNIPNPKTDELFCDWYNSKSRFIEAMGDKLIWESPKILNFRESPEAEKEHIDKYIKFLNEITLFELANFVEMNRESFIENKITNIPDNKKGIIPKGTKLIKAFKYFVSGTDKILLPKLQDKASQVIQQTSKLRGRLCFSVHPLDYLTISENTNKWTTCHSMKNTYCAGNLSYMADKATVVCYLKDEDDVQLGHFPRGLLWNNKKWRTLLFVADKCSLIFASKQYPFSSESVMKKVLELFNERKNKIALGNYGNWTDYCITDVETPNGQFHLTKKYLPISGNLVALDKILGQPIGCLNYNDILYGHDTKLCYTTFNSSIMNNTPLMYMAHPGEVEVGRPVKCLNCGKHNIFLANGDVLCKKCEMEIGTVESDFFRTCKHCGKRLFMEKEGTWIDDEENVVCEDCYSKYGYKECSYCNEPMMEKYLILNEEDNKYYCKDCYKNLEVIKERRNMYG